MIRTPQEKRLIANSLASGIVLALLAWKLYSFIEQRLVREFDAELLKRASAIAAMVEQTRSGITVDPELARMPAVVAGPDYFELWLNDGRVLARSPSLMADELPRPATEPDPHGMAVRLPDDHQGRLLAKLFTLRSARGAEAPRANGPIMTGVVVVAARSEALEKTLHQLRLWCSLFCGLGMAAAAGLLRWIEPVQPWGRDTSCGTAGRMTKSQRPKSQ